MRKVIFAVSLFAASFLAGQTSTVSFPVNDASGNPACPTGFAGKQCQISVQPSAPFNTYLGQYVNMNVVNANINNGTFTISLYQTVNSSNQSNTTPVGARYNVTYTFNTGAGYTECWSIMPSLTPLTNLQVKTCGPVPTPTVFGPPGATGATGAPGLGPTGPTGALIYLAGTQLAGSAPQINTPDGKALNFLDSPAPGGSIDTTVDNTEAILTPVQSPRTQPTLALSGTPGVVTIGFHSVLINWSIDPCTSQGRMTYTSSLSGSSMPGINVSSSSNAQIIVSNIAVSSDPRMATGQTCIWMSQSGGGIMWLAGSVSNGTTSATVNVPDSSLTLPLDYYNIYSVAEVFGNGPTGINTTACLSAAVNGTVPFFCFDELGSVVAPNGITAQLKLVNVDTFGNFLGSVELLTEAANNGGAVLFPDVGSAGVGHVPIIRYISSFHNFIFTDAGLTANDELLTMPDCPNNDCIVAHAGITLTSNGSTQNLLQKLATVGTASRTVDATTSDVSGLVGIAEDAQSAGSPVFIRQSGLATCQFDGSTTAGDYVQASTSTAGNCHDAGSTFPTSNQIIGRVLSTNSGSGAYQIEMFESEVIPGGGGGGGDLSGSANELVVFNSGSTGTGFTTLTRNPSTGDLVVNGVTLGIGNNPGKNNTALGDSALSSVTGSTGIEDVAVGYQAMISMLSGHQNVAIGVFALLSSTAGDANTMVGYSSGSGNTGSNNTGVGNNTLIGSGHGNSNTAVGNGALTQDTNGSDNTAVGDSALQAVTTSSGNTAVGYHAGFNVGGGTGNVIMGEQALASDSSGSGNTAIGDTALGQDTAGQNTAVGFQASFSNTSGNPNVAVGYQSLYYIDVGGGNIAIGYKAGNHIADNVTPNASSSRSIYIGDSTDSNADGDTNEIVIGDSGVGNGSNTTTIGNTSTTETFLFGILNISSGGSATTLTCWKSDGKTLGHATMSGGNISACN